MSSGRITDILLPRTHINDYRKLAHDDDDDSDTPEASSALLVTIVVGVVAALALLSVFAKLRIDPRFEKIYIPRYLMHP